MSIPGRVFAAESAAADMRDRPVDTAPSEFNCSTRACWVAANGPKVLWDRVPRWVDAGKYVTSAGVSAGTDLGFYLVSRLAGRTIAETAVRAAEYDWHRDPRQPIRFPPQAEV
jgi:hypothetical protein